MGVDIILKIAGIGILTAVVSVILKKSDRDDVATFATLAGLIVVIVLVIDMISGLFDTIKSLLSLYS
ncbi:MAG: stage III sporulation protein AC [Clostridia bacterium]|nr:stage III sporulation protein AC [Clostridia bacterium]